jgi:hypothetical protein
VTGGDSAAAALPRNTIAATVNALACFIASSSYHFVIAVCREKGAESRI